MNSDVYRIYLMSRKHSSDINKIRIFDFDAFNRRINALTVVTIPNGEGRVITQNDITSGLTVYGDQNWRDAMMLFGADAIDTIKSNESFEDSLLVCSFRKDGDIWINERVEQHLLKLNEI